MTYTKQQVSWAEKIANWIWLFIKFVFIPVAILILLWEILKAISSFLPSSENFDSSQHVIDKIGVNKSNLRFDDSIYADVANQIYGEMQGLQTNGDEEMRPIVNLISDYNADELKQVIKEFGVKESSIVDNFGAGFRYGTLTQWLAQQTSGTTKSMLRHIFKTRLDITIV